MQSTQMQERLVGFTGFTVYDAGRKASISVLLFSLCGSNKKRKGSTVRNTNSIVLLVEFLLRFDRIIIRDIEYFR